jgi:hypothetical protein
MVDTESDEFAKDKNWNLRIFLPILFITMGTVTKNKISGKERDRFYAVDTMVEIENVMY